MVDECATKRSENCLVYSFWQDRSGDLFPVVEIGLVAPSGDTTILEFTLVLRQLLIRFQVIFISRALVI